MSADASFAIEIAANMGGAESTIAELDEMVSAFTGAGKNASVFQDAIKQVSAQLDVARAAQVAANEALSAGQAEYALLETAALQAAKAAERLASKGMTREYLEAAQKAGLAEQAVNDYGVSLRALERNAAGAAREEEHLAQTLGNVRKLGGHADKVIAKHAESLSKLGGALGAVGGPLGSIGQKLTAPVKGFSELSGVMGNVNAAAVIATVGVVALGAAILAAGAAAAIGLAKFTFWAVRLADKEGRLQTQTDRLSSNFDDLFSGLNIEPVIAGMEILANLFDRTTAAGETVAFIFESIFQPLIDQATNAALVVEAFYLGFLIGAVKLYIALKPTIAAIAELFGFSDTSLTDLLASAKNIGELLAPVILIMAAAFGAALLVVAALTAAVAAVIGVLVAAPVVIYQVGAAVLDGMVGAFSAAVDFIKGIDFVAIGVSVVQGIAQGIASAAGAVLSAITGVVGGAINAAKSLLGIASPSKVFAEMGVNTGEGMTSGVEDATSDVHAAYEEMVAPDVAAQTIEASAPLMAADPALQAADVANDIATADAIPAAIPSAGESPAAAPAAASPSGGTRDFSNAVFNFNGIPNAEAAVASFREMLLMSDEELALMAGAGEAVA